MLLTGDYIDQSAAYIKPVVEELARLQPRIATVAVLGNHDWWEDAPLMRREFARTNILLLDNSRRVLTTERRLEADGGDGLVLAGVGDLMEDKPDYDKALDGLPTRLPRLLLSHNPDVAEEPALLESGLRVDLIVSGHTHGSRIWLPGLGTPMIPSRYGQKYAQGLVQGPRCPVFISRGHDTTAWWLANVADVRVHGETKQRPVDRHALEVPHLLALPAVPMTLPWWCTGTCRRKGWWPGRATTTRCRGG